MSSELPDLVKDSQIRVEFHATDTHRFSIESDYETGNFIKRKEKETIWSKERLLGAGRYGDVCLYRCLNNDKSELQAVKILNKRQMSTDGLNYYRELEAIARFSQKKFHGLFVEYIGWYESLDSVFIAMEYMQHGDLQCHLTRALAESEAQNIAAQILDSLDYLHRNDFVHRDLKPANILVARPAPAWWVKIGDFGISKRVTANTSLQTMIGTRLYMAPEVQMLFPPHLEDDSAAFHYNNRVDIWSLGVTTFYMVFHDHPFISKRPHELPKYVRGSPLPFPTQPLQILSQNCYEFIKGTMAADPSARPSASEALEYEWLKQRSQHHSPPINTLVNNNISDSPASNSIPKLFESSDSGVTFECENCNRLTRCQDMGKEFYERKEYDAAERLFRNAAEGRERYFGLTHPDTWGSLSLLGQTTYKLGKYHEAEKVFRKLFRARKNAVGSNDSEYILALHWLGMALCRQRKDTEAERLFQDVFRRRLEMLGPSDPETLDAQYHLSQTFYSLKRYPEAVNTLKLVLSGQENALSDTDLKVLSTKHLLGMTLYQEENYDEAEPFFQQAFDSRATLLGVAHEDSLSSLFWLGRTFFASEQYVKAVSSFQQMMTVQRISFTPSTAAVSTKHWLGIAMYQQGDYISAEATLHHVVEERKKTLGLMHQDTLMSLHWHGKALVRQEFHEEGEIRLKQAAEGRKQVLGPTHPETLESLELLSDSLVVRGEHQKAWLIWKDLLDGREKSLGPKNTKTIRTIRKLGLSLEAQRNIGQAKECFELVKQMRIEILGPDHRLTWESVDDVKRCEAYSDYSSGGGCRVM